MKSKEEIEKLAFLEYPRVINDPYNPMEDDNTYERKIWIDAYTQCQEDMIELLKEEIRRAYIHGQGNGQMMEVGLERDEVDDYTNSRMLSLKKD
jgi:hypothetical protein